MGRGRAAGVDCLGFIAGLFTEIEGHPPDWGGFDIYDEGWDRPEKAKAMIAGLARNLRAVPPTPIKSGAIAVFRLTKRSNARHLGVIAATSTPPLMIHADRKYGVVEVPFSKSWRNRLEAQYLFPKVLEWQH